MNGLVSGVITILAMLGFIAACYWAFTRKNRDKWERMGRLPMEQDQREESDNGDKQEKTQ